MTKYIVKDIEGVMCYLPYGLVVGMVVAILLAVINDCRVKRKKSPFCVPAITGYIVYLVVLLFITFWSREDGNRNAMDLELFSTWGINDRNNAFVFENIMLFIPYGFFTAWVIPFARKLWSSILVGVGTSILIEILQLVTGRGFFQIDDVLTNGLGAVIGYVLYRVIAGVFVRFR